MFNLVTGKLGSGKSLYSISEAWNYYKDGRRVAANFPIDFSQRRHTTKSLHNTLTVLPDLPTPNDLLGLGVGGKTEHTAGLLIIDEAARWLNSRDWVDKNRKEVIDWLLHSRKLGWDVILIAQTHEMIDKQVRSGLMEYHTVCRRLDRVKFLGVRLPHIHLATTYYGIKTDSASSPPKADKRWYKPQEWGKYYDTNALFKQSSASYTMLSRWFIVVRHLQVKSMSYYPILFVKIIYFIVLYVSSKFSKGVRYELNKSKLPYLGAF